MMSSVFFRPKPLKLQILRTNTSANSAGDPWLVGHGVVDEDLRLGNYTLDYNYADSNQWKLYYPGIYRIECVGSGGGGGGGDTFYTGKGYGGTAGEYDDELFTLRKRYDIRQGLGGDGGAPNSTYGEAGESGNVSYVVGLTGAAGTGGSGGAGSTNSTGATSGQQQGEAGETASDGVVYGKGGDGAPPNGYGVRGGKGVVILTLVG